MKNMMNINLINFNSRTMALLEHLQLHKSESGKKFSFELPLSIGDMSDQDETFDNIPCEFNLSC